MRGGGKSLTTTVNGLPNSMTAATTMAKIILFIVALLHAGGGQAFQAQHGKRRGRSAESMPSSASSAAKQTGSHLSSSALGVSSKSPYKRRSFIQNFLSHPIIFSAAGLGGASAAFADTPENAPSQPKITHKVYMDLRISRADGTFYVRDTNPSTGAPDTEAESPFYGRLVLGLFGDATPNHVQQFLSYADVKYEVENPLPSYSKSKFGTLDSSTGLLIGGTIPGLDVTTFAGGNALEYSGRITAAKLWLEDKNDKGAPKLSHDAKGLLTHRNLDVTPSFGITTRNQSQMLDATHTIFGCVLEDKDGFLERVVDLPVLTDRGLVSRTANELVAGGNGDVGSSVASSVFNAQRAVFRDAAKTFGDTRLDKTYDGKILRRIEVTKIGVL